MPSPPFDLASLASRLSRRPPKAAEAPPATITARASVAAILRDPGDGRDAELLFIRRAEHEHDPWSGHMAFPGGRRDDADPTLLATAVRETLEEVGLDLGVHGTLLAELPEIPAIARGRRTGMIISPFVFALERDVPLAFDAAEVADAFWMPFGPLARKEGADTLVYEIEGKAVELPCLKLERGVLWGLTYRMLEMLLDAVR